jgi:hypothetical protein
MEGLKIIEGRMEFDYENNNRNGINLNDWLILPLFLLLCVLIYHQPT